MRLNLNLTPYQSCWLLELPKSQQATRIQKKQALGAYGSSDEVKFAPKRGGGNLIKRVAVKFKMEI